MVQAVLHNLQMICPYFWHPIFICVHACVYTVCVCARKHMQCITLPVRNQRLICIIFSQEIFSHKISTVIIAL